MIRRRKFAAIYPPAKSGATLGLAAKLLYGEAALLEQYPLLQEVLLQPVLLCVTGIEKKPSWETMVSILAKEYEAVVRKAWRLGLQDSPANRPLFFTAASDVKLIHLLPQRVLQTHLPLPYLAQRAVLWDFFAERDLGEKALPSQELAVKMKLSLGGTEKVVKRLACLPKEEWTNTRIIFRYCYEILDDGRYDTIKRVETTYTYDDLKLEESQKKIIRDICAQVEYRKKAI